VDNPGRSFSLKNQSSKRDHSNQSDHSFENPRTLNKDENVNTATAIQANKQAGDGVQSLEKFQVETF
jgi:hypothetical protein